MKKIFLLLALMTVLIYGLANAAEIPLYTATLNYDNGYMSQDKKFFATFLGANFVPHDKLILIQTRAACQESWVSVLTDRFSPQLVTGRYVVTVYYTNTSSPVTPESPPVRLDFYSATNRGGAFLVPEKLIATCSGPAVDGLHTGACAANIPLNSSGHIDVVIKAPPYEGLWITGITIQQFRLTPTSPNQGNLIK